MSYFKNRFFEGISYLLILLSLNSYCWGQSEIHNEKNRVHELIEELSSTHWMNKESIIRDIAAYGTSGIDAGVVITKLLSHEDWDIRVAAARAIGFIEYQQASTVLIEMLENQNDWRLVYVAAESLGRLGEINSISALKRISTKHWFPRVRVIANKSIHVIQGTDIFEKIEVKNSYGWFNSYKKFDIEKICNPKDFKLAKVNTENKKYRNQALSDVEIFKYKVPYYEDYKYIEETDDYIPIGKVMYEEKMGSVALRFGDKWLVGSDRGEWGGALSVVNNEGESDRLLRKNVQDIFDMEIGPIALTSLDHLILHYADIYKIVKGKNGVTKAEKYMNLPWAPREAWKLENGDILINTSYDSLIFTKEGKLEMAVCDAN